MNRMSLVVLLPLLTLFSIAVAGCTPSALAPAVQSTPTVPPTPTVEPTSTSTVPAPSPGTSIVKEKAYEISIPPGWTQTEILPQGADVGFRKELAEGQYATFYFHHEVMPLELAELPSSTDFKQQWNAMLGNQYPDVRSVGGAIPDVRGRIVFNGTYELTDAGQKVRRRYTYFLSDRTAFIVQSSASPTQWDSVLTDFDSMLISLQPGVSPPEIQTQLDESATDELKRNLPTLFGSFPSPWRDSLADVTLTHSSSDDKRTLEITFKFHRADIGEIYTATKTVFDLIKAGKSDAELNNLPAETQRTFSNSPDFIMYVSQVGGVAWHHVANVSPAVERFTLTILDSKGQRAGAISISREDLSTILTGKVKASEGQRLAAMYIFE